jgi:hypothetical protein
MILIKLIILADNIRASITNLGSNNVDDITNYRIDLKPNTNILKGYQIRIKFSIDFIIDKNLLKCINLNENLDLKCNLLDDNYILIDPIEIVLPALSAGASIPYQIRINSINNP